MTGGWGVWVLGVGVAAWMASETGPTVSVCPRTDLASRSHISSGEMLVVVVVVTMVIWWWCRGGGSGDEGIMVETTVVMGMVLVTVVIGWRWGRWLWCVGEGGGYGGECGGGDGCDGEWEGRITLEGTLL